MTITRNFDLFLNPTNGMPLTIKVSQYDSGEEWVFTLLYEDGTQYTPSDGAIIGVKADGHGIANEAYVDSQGRVVVEETEQMTAAPGIGRFELSIDGLTHGTANFIVKVEPKPTDEAIMSDSDLSLIQQALDAEGMVVTFTMNGSWREGFPGECNHSAEEIYEAIQNGTPINATAYFTEYESGLGENVISKKITDYRVDADPYYYDIVFICAPMIERSSAEPYRETQIEIRMNEFQGNLAWGEMRGVGDWTEPPVYVDLYADYTTGTGFSNIILRKTWDEIQEAIRHAKKVLVTVHVNKDGTHRTDYITTQIKYTYGDNLYFCGGGIVEEIDGQKVISEITATITRNDEVTLQYVSTPIPNALDVRFEVEYEDQYTSSATCNRTYAEIYDALTQGRDINAYAVITQGYVQGIWGKVVTAKLVTIEDTETRRINFYSATEHSWAPNDQYLRLIQIQYDEIGSDPINFGYIKIPYKPNW